MHAVRVTVICDECVRIEYAPGGRFCDHPSLFAINGPAGDAALAREAGSTAFASKTTSADAGSPPIQVSTRRLTLTYTPDGRPPHAGNMRATITHPAPPADVPAVDGRVVWTPGIRNRHNLGGTLSTLDGLRREHPIGEGLLARDGWHLVDDSARHVLVDGWAMERERLGLGRNLDWYLFAYGTDYAAALRALAVVAGRVPLPRKYAMGAWYSRYWPYTSDEFRGIVDEFEVHGFPLDVLVLDMDWHRPGWTGWSWNRELLPDAEELVEWLHARGLAVTLNLHPADGVGPHEDRYAAFMRALGKNATGETLPFDAGNRAYMRALFEQVHAPLDGMRGGLSAPESAIDFWWVDWQQDKFVRSIPELTNLRWLNHLYFEHSARSGGANTDGVRGLSFARWAGDEGGPDAGTEWGSPAAGGWGDHRHPIHFSGDAHTGWDMLAFQVPFTVAAGNIGCFFWSHDIGGHFGPRLEEAAARWVQFGAFSGVLRLHSARTTTLDRRPWTYEARFCEAMRAAFDLRARLFPYLYSCARECWERTLPLLRPMYLAWPERERAYGVPGQYMIGEALLCAPIVSRGMGERCVATRHVWFPPAAGGWHNLLTGEHHGAEEEAIVSGAIDETPLYVRSGAMLPGRPSTRRMATEPLRTVTLHVFPGADGQTERTALYEDDGISQAYQRDGWSSTPLAASWKMGSDGRSKVLCATIGPTKGAYGGQVARRGYQVRLGGVHRPLECLVDGTRAEWSFDPDALGGLMVVELPDRDIGASVEIGISFEPSDGRLVAHRTRLRHLGEATGAVVGTTHLREAILAAAGTASGDADEHQLRAALLGIGAGIGIQASAGQVRVVDSLGWLDAGSGHLTIVDRLDGRETMLAGRALAFERREGHGRVAGLAMPDTPLAEPPAGMRSSRVARASFELHGTPLTVERELESKTTPLTRFSIAGPFAWDWRRSIVDVAEEPERGLPAPGARFTGRDGASFGWTPAKSGAKWPVDVRVSLGARGGLAYAATMLESPCAQEATLVLEAGDKLEAFLNGAKVITLDDHSAHGATEPRVRITLRPGGNVLVIKVVDGGGGWGFHASIDGQTPLAHAMA